MCGFLFKTFFWKEKKNTSKSQFQVIIYYFQREVWNAQFFHLVFSSSFSSEKSVESLWNENQDCANTHAHTHVPIIITIHKFWSDRKIKSKQKSKKFFSVLVRYIFQNLIKIKIWSTRLSIPKKNRVFFPSSFTVFVRFL